MKINPLRTLAALCLLAVAITVLGVTASAMSENGAGSRDFIAYWAAGQQLVHGTNPYDSVAMLRLERTAGFDGDRPLIMRNPPLAFFLALPLGFVSSKLGMILWLLVLIASLMASIRMLWILHGQPNSRVHLLGYCFAPILACLMAGQLGIFLLLGITLFLRFYKSRPFSAGAALLLCSIKPHLFLPLGIVLLAWAVSRKAYRILAGFGFALLASSALSFCFDPRAWHQYAQMMNMAGVQEEFVPTLSLMFRLLVDRQAAWPQFVPAIAGCAWALWYFWTRRNRWNWMDQGLLLLIVSVGCAPYAWFTDESVLLPAILAALYRAENSNRSLLPFGVIDGIALIEVMTHIQITTVFYLWTVPAWLGWYLYATGGKGAPTGEVGSDAEGGTSASALGFQAGSIPTSGPGSSSQDELLC